jgi:hypothetical protein
MFESFLQGVRAHLVHDLAAVSPLTQPESLHLPVRAVDPPVGGEPGLLLRTSHLEEFDTGTDSQTPQ